MRWIISRRKRSISSAARLRKVSSSAFAGFELFAVDEQGVWPGKRVAVLIEVAEKSEAPVLGCGRRPIVASDAESRNEVINQLRDGSVLANNNEAGRHPTPTVFPNLECLLVVSVKCFEEPSAVSADAKGIE